MSTTEEFTQLATRLDSQGIEGVFQQLIGDLRQQCRWHDLFDALLMQARYRLGLPIILTATLDELDEPVRTQVEDAYLDACREVGHHLLDEGRIRESWVYLRPVGELADVAARLDKIEVEEENVEELIEIALHEGVSPPLGFRLVLENYGTCNAITTFDTEVARRSRPHQEQAAAMLVRHLHQELLANLRAEIQRQEGAPPSEQTIASLVEDRDWLFLNSNYHIDTTHLASVTRIARLVQEPEVLRLAIDLTEYGRRLAEQYRLHGEEPFMEVYPHHALFFQAQLGEQVEQALQHFRDRAENLSVEREGTLPAETYIVLLDRLGRTEEAVNEHARLIPASARTTGFSPTLLELARKSGCYEQLMQIAEQRGDVLSYTAALIEKQLQA